MTLILSWILFGYVVGSSLALATSYVALPIVRREVRLHVLLLALSYSVFISASLLHSIGLWPHDVTQRGLMHFGVPGAYVLLGASIFGVVGISVALRLVIARICAEG